jgi:pectin methylesterase-like acyl-CoA thioesterase
MHLPTGILYAAAKRLGSRVSFMGELNMCGKTALRLRIAGIIALLALMAAAMPAVVQGAALLGDDFEDGNATGWATNGGSWSVVTDGTQVYHQRGISANARAVAGSSSWTDIAVEARVKPLAFNGSTRFPFVGVLARLQGATNYYYLALRNNNTLELGRTAAGSNTALASRSIAVTTGAWYTLKLEAIGASLKGYINGVQQLSAVDTRFSWGKIGLASSFASALFDDIAVTPVNTIVVAQDGSGQFTTVRAAVDAVPTGNSERTIIRIKPGTYHELIDIPASKPLITLIGDTGNPRDVVITFDNASGTPKPDGSGTYGTSGSASVVVSGNDFQAYNLTFENAFDEQAHPEIANKQAVAVRTVGDRLVFDNVRFIGNQDTLYANSPSTTATSRQYYHNCYVEGDVDFIFGRGTAVFDHCTIKALSRGSTSNNGYVTAASTPDTQTYGFLIVNSTIESDAPAQTFHLGRPWHPSNDPHAIAQVVIRDTWLPAAIKDAPWTDFSGFSWRDARLFEYNNSGPGAAVNETRPQLTADQAASYTVQSYLSASDGWNPI